MYPIPMFDQCFTKLKLNSVEQKHEIFAYQCEISDKIAEINTAAQPPGNKKNSRRRSKTEKIELVGKRQKEKNKSYESRNFAHKNENGWMITRKSKNYTYKSTELTDCPFRIRSRDEKTIANLPNGTCKKKSFLEKRSPPINS